MATYNDTIDENLNTSHNFLVGFSAAVSENLEVSTSFALDLYTHILEGINATSSLISSGSFSSSLVDKVTLRDTISVLFPILLSDIITVDDSITELKLRLADIIESLRVNDTPSSRATFNTALALSLVMTDLAERGWRKEILELVDVYDEVVDLFVRSAILIDQIELTMVQSEFFILGALAQEDLTALDDIDLQSILNSELVDQFQFVGAMRADGFYNTYSFNPEGYALSTYSNFNFNSIAEFQGQYLMANSEGLYQYGGTTDSLVDIVATLKTTAIDFNTSSKKQVKKMYLGVTNDCSIILKVLVDGKSSQYYELDSKTVGLDTQAIKIGKGLVGRYWQFELITKNNSSLELDEIEFIPVEFRRKI